jgi:hypothetical protein
MKNSKNIIPVFLMAAAAYTSGGSAGPSMNSKCNYTLATPRNASGVIFNESCDIAYVKPPKLGTAKITSLMRTTNLQFCGAVKSIDPIANRTVKSMDILSQKVQEMILAFEPLDQELLNMKLELATAKSEMDSAKKQLMEAEIKVQDLGKDINNTRQAYENCLQINSSDHPVCFELKTAWDEAKNEGGKFYSGEYAEKRSNAFYATENYDLLAGRFTVHRDRYTDAIAPMLGLQERLIELSFKTMELYREYTKLDGAIGQIVWSIPWDRLLDDYRRMNLSLRVNWSPLPIKEAELVSTVSNLGTVADLGSIPAIKSSSIPGARHTGFAGMGNGQEVIGAQLEASAPTQATVIFGNSVSGQIVLTLVGACPYFDDIEDRTNVDIDDLTATMVNNLVYTYELAVRRSYTARYNLSELLRKIEQKSKRGGFFSTKSAHSIIEDNDSSEWFIIDFGGNTSEFKYSKEEQRQIARELKQELMDKAMRQFSILNAGSAVPPSVPDFVESGAQTSAWELRRCWHLYCQVGSAVIGIGQSIWGRSNAVANFYHNNSSWATEQVNGIQFINRSETLSFKRE